MIKFVNEDATEKVKNCIECYENIDVLYFIFHAEKNPKGEIEDFTLVYANKGAEKIENIKREEYIGKTFREKVKEIDEGLLDYVKTVVQEKAPQLRSSFHNTAGKDIRVMSYLIEDDYIGCVGTDTGVSVLAEKLKAVERDVKAKNEMYEIAVSSSSINIWEYDIESKKIKSANVERPNAFQVKVNGLEERMGELPEGAIKLGYIREDSIDNFRNLYEKINQGAKSATADIWVLSHSTKKWWCESVTYTNIFDDNGKVVRTIGVGKDITEIVRAEEKYIEEMNAQKAMTGKGLVVQGRANLAEDIFEKYETNGMFDILGSGNKYSDCMRNIASGLFTESQKQIFLNTMDRENLLKKFEKGETYFELEYQRKTTAGKYIWVRSLTKLFNMPDGKGIGSFMYTYNINDEYVFKMIINTLISKDYENLSLIDPKTGALENFEYAGGEDLRNKQESTFDIEVEKVVEGIISEELKEEAYKAFSLEAIQKGLAENNMYEFGFPTIDEMGNKRRKRWQFSKSKDANDTIVATRSDVTELFKAQQKQQEVLRVALQQAKTANEAKSDFLSRMSHEIRTPMNAIIGMSTLAIQNIGDQKQVSDYLSKVGISARFLLSLINDILDMSRIESGKVILKKEKIGFEEFINGINVICYEQAEAKGIEYDTIVTSFLEDYYIGDYMKLQQILINIISNAIKFTDEGGTVQFIIHQERITNGKAHLKFTVNDTGVGINEDFIPVIFDPFEQSRNVYKSSYEGTGLGLAICKNLLDLMGGSISVNSIEGVGSEFIVELDLDVSEETKKLTDMKNEMNLVDITALIVDDEIMTCEQAQKTLGDMGVKAEWASSGEKAIKLVEEKWENSDCFDVIFIDWKMPDMDGIETTRHIRKIVGSDVTIIIITAYDWSSIEQKARMAGANMLISKPLFKGTLTSAFEKIYEEKEDGADESEETEYDFTGRRALLVEDHLLNIEVAKKLLEAKGFEVDVAENGLEALENYATSEVGYYDVILMDIRMPVMDGLTAAKSIRKLRKETARSIPIIAMSANAFDEDLEKSKAAGMNDHLAKPIDADLLYRTILENLGGGRHIKRKLLR